MAVEDRHAVGVPFFGERDVAVIGLVGKTLFLERADRFVDRGLRHVELRRDVDRPDRHLRRASQHHDGFKVVLVRHGHFFHGTLLLFVVPWYHTTGGTS